MSSGAFSLSSLYSIESFELTNGVPVLGGMKGGTRHYFCPECLTWMYTIPEGLDDYVNVRSPLLENYTGQAPFAEFYLDEALPSMSAGTVRSYRMAPNNDDFVELMKEYGARDA